MCRGGIGELDKEFSDFSLLEDKDFEDGAKLAELLVDELIGDLESHGVIDADQEDTGRFLLVDFSTLLSPLLADHDINLLSRRKNTYSLTPPSH